MNKTVHYLVLDVYKESAPVALALVAGNGVELARIGHQYRGPQAGQITADPWTMRARFQRDGGVGKLREQLRQGGPGVAQ